MARDRWGDALSLKGDELDEATMLVCKQLGVSAEDVLNTGMKEDKTMAALTNVRTRRARREVHRPPGKGATTINQGFHRGG